MDEEDFEAHLIACNYIRFRLKLDGYSWKGCPQLPPPSDAVKLMENMCQFFELKFGKRLQKTVDIFSMNDTIPYFQFMKVGHSLFSGYFSWNKLVALHVFAGLLAIKCVKMDYQDKITDIADWLGIYVECELYKQVADFGGWNGFVNHYKSTWKWWKWKNVLFLIILILSTGDLNLISLNFLSIQK